MRKASPWMLEKGIQTPSPSPDPIPAQNHKLLLRNLHGNWNIERGHVRGAVRRSLKLKAAGGASFATPSALCANVIWPTLAVWMRR